MTRMSDWEISGAFWRGIFVAGGDIDNVDEEVDNGAAEGQRQLPYGNALMALRKDAEAIEVWQRFLAVANPELVEDALDSHAAGDEVIADVRSKLDALMSVDQPNTPA
jgi:hypothetical protein